MNYLQKIYFLIFISLAFVAHSQTGSSQTTTIEEMSKKRQDPVAGLRSIYLQGVLLPVGNGVAQSYSVQPVWPFKLAENLKLITYTIVPFQTVPTVGGVSHVPVQPLSVQGSTSGRASGLGNILFNGYFSSVKKKGKVSWGIGPAIQLPTRTNEALGSNKISLGPSFLFNHGGDKLSGGFVVQNYWSLGGEGVNKVNSLNLQYFAYYNLSKGWFLESNATVLNNWLADDGNQLFLPIGGGGGKTFAIGNSGLYYCATAQLFYNAVRPSNIGGWEAVFQFQIIL